VYWSSDSFATPMPAPVRDVAELDSQLWLEGMATFDHYISPWLELADESKFQRAVDRVELLSPSAMVGCHTPAIRQGSVAAALASTRRTLSAVVPPQPDQSVLDEIQRALEPSAA
jgi:hypothetical protein